MWTGFLANKIYEANPTSVTPSAVANGDPAGVVPSTLLAQWNGEVSNGSTFPEMKI
jgi:hypothetical protein